MVQDRGARSGGTGGDDRDPVVVEPLPVGPAMQRGWGRSGLVAGLVVALVVGAAVVVAAVGGDDSTGGDGRGVDRGAKRAVLAALSATEAAGNYDMAFTLHVTPASGGSSSGPCPMVTLSPRSTTGSPSPPVRCATFGGPSQVDVSGHGTVNVDPYAMVAISNVTGLGAVSLYVNGTTVWEQGGANYGFAQSGSAPGASLSGFAQLVEGTLGRGQGALAMISLATHSGYLSLEQEAVLGATQAGTGSVDGTSVTYYDVTVDIGRLADATNLTDEERTAIQDAYAVLVDAGYSGTDERIGVDAAGFIRDVTATTHFGDGSASTRHTTFSNYGCAAKVSMPDEQPPAVSTDEPCTSPDTTTTTTAPAITSPASTSTAPATTSPAPGATSSTTTSSAPTTTTTPETTTTTRPADPSSP